MCFLADGTFSRVWYVIYTILSNQFWIGWATLIFLLRDEVMNVQKFESLNYDVITFCLNYTIILLVFTAAFSEYVGWFMPLTFLIGIIAVMSLINTGLNGLTLLIALISLNQISETTSRREFIMMAVFSSCVYMAITLIFMFTNTVVARTIGFVIPIFLQTTDGLTPLLFSTMACIAGMYATYQVERFRLIRVFLELNIVKIKLNKVGTSMYSTRRNRTYRYAWIISALYCALSSYPEFRVLTYIKIKLVFYMIIGSDCIYMKAFTILGCLVVTIINTWLIDEVIFTVPEVPPLDLFMDKLTIAVKVPSKSLFF